MTAQGQYASVLLAFWILGWLPLAGDELLRGWRGQERLPLHLSLLSNHLACPARQHRVGCVSMQGEEGGASFPGRLPSVTRQTNTQHPHLLGNGARL